MSNEKFTPGEWEYCISGGEAGYPLVFEMKTGLEIASVFIQNGYTENGIANAHLIAAAPEMYRMLKLVHGILGSGSLSMEIENLLKKARGEI